MSLCSATPKWLCYTIVNKTWQQYLMLHTLCDKDFNDIAVRLRNISASLLAIPTGL